jgi:hypothetical protein
MNDCIVLGRAMLGHAEGGDPMSKLILYDAMCAAINRAYQIDEAKDIRDKALAIEVYAHQAKNKEAEQKAEKIRLRASTRQAGCCPDGEGDGSGAIRAAEAPIVRFGGHTAQTLSSLGISKQQFPLAEGRRTFR